MSKLHINLDDIIQELRLGAFHAATDNDKSFFDEIDGCLVANIRRGKFHYLVIWDFIECEIQIYEASGELEGETPDVWSINTVTGELSEL